MYVYVCVRACIRVCVRACVRECMRARARACARARTRARARARVRVPSSYIYHNHVSEILKICYRKIPVSGSLGVKNVFRANRFEH